MGAQSRDAQAITVSVYGRSDRGRVRTANQDRLLVADLGGAGHETPRFDESEDSFTVGASEFALAEAGAILMVADGMGGRAGGARASAAAVSTVADEMSDGASAPTAPDFVRRLDEALRTANQVIHEEGSRDEGLRGMGTTGTLVGLLGTRAYVAQVGDSRAYLARGGALGRLTRDQSLVQDLIDSGMLSEEDAKNVPSNQILQAIGASPTVQPALTYHELRRGDVLLLCSDGLSGVVSDEEVRAAVEAAADGSTLCDKLVDLANARGGPDNITVLVARLDGEGLDGPDGAEIDERLSYTPTPE